MGLGIIFIGLGHMIEKKKIGSYRGKLGNKHRKLAESSYFFNCMYINEDKPGVFQFNYSAFLSAARSVLQYVYEEVDPGRNAHARRGANKWYQKAVGSKAIKFGKDERDENIHRDPVSPDTHVTVFPKEIVAGRENVLDFLSNKLVSGNSPKSDDERMGSPVYAKPSYKYTSSRWKGHETILEVCRMYLDELEALVKEGISKGYIAP
jgi:hypothetical protein